MRRLLLAFLTVGSGLLFATTAAARPARVDIAGPPYPNGAFSGEFWSADNAVSNPAGTYVDSDPITFLLNIGSGATSYNFCFAGNGYLSLAASCGSAVPTQNYVQVFTPSQNWTQMQWSTGKVDTIASAGSPTYSESEAVNAMRFTWRTVDTIAQLLLLDRGAGDFDLELNYGLFDSANAVASDSIGYYLGTNQLAISDVLGPSTYTCEFRGGVSSCGSPVPLPAPALLLASGLAGLWMQRRRRASPTSGA
jgi:hypothetical protein